MKLLIVESPTKARTIQRYLGKEYKVVASQGHVRDLSLKGEGSLGVDIKNNFAPDYEISSRSKGTISYLNKLSKDASEIYLATDPDREGEAIAWHLADELNLDIEKTKRLVFNEITKKAISEAFDNARLLDMNLVKSQETRRILDRIIGFELSGLLQRKIGARSAGRVQSVVLKLANEKEKEIEQFKEKISYGLNALIKSDNKEYKVELVDEKLNPLKSTTKNELKELLKLEGEELLLEEIISEETNKYPFPPFTTSSLQQDAFSKFKFSPSKTNKIAQKLYEGVSLEKETTGLITYMRTDSIRLSGGFIYATREYISENYGEEYLGFVKTQKTDSKIQDAHEAIRPTKVELTPTKVKAYLSKDEFNLYELIWNRAVASMMKHSVIKNDKAIFSFDKHKFSTDGKEVLFEGYQALYKIYEKEKIQPLPHFKINQKYPIKTINVSEHKTQPPYRYNEGTLIKTMEKLGIGRPSTYASTIDSLKKSYYIEIKKGYIFVTNSGKVADEKLKDFFSDIINVDYTANMENELDKIAEGEMKKEESLNSFYNPFKEKVVEAYKNMEKKEFEKTGEICPECGGELVKKNGRYGEFIGCENNPTCKYIKRKTIIIPEDAPACPSCKDGKLLVRKGRYGEFYGCSNYPKCKHNEAIKK